MVELRKRKRASSAPPAEEIEVPPEKKITLAKKILSLPISTASQNTHHSSIGPESLGGTLRAPQQGDLIELDGFGGEVDLTHGDKATLQNLVDISVGGVVIFTYPKANTPGCNETPPTQLRSHVVDD